MCDVLNFFGENLAGPVLAALIGGPLAALAFRWASVPGEVNENDARAIELDEDLDRWVRDRGRILDADIRRLVEETINEARSTRAVIEPIDSPDMVIIGPAAELMRDALQQYRDEATRKAREFSALARSEGRLHRWRRRRRKAGTATLGLDGNNRIALNRWRQRPNPVAPGGQHGPDLRVLEDPTEGESSIAALETEAGLTWGDAARRSTL
jgi:hypothetical protein